MSDQSNVLPIGEKYYSKIIFKDKFEFNPLNIISITIKEWVFEILPKVELVLKYDPSIFEQYTIEDNDTFSIHLANSPKNPNMFKIDCMVHDYKISVIGDDRAKAIQITGILKCKNMFTLQNKCYSKKNSYQVFQEIAGDVGLSINKSQNVNQLDKMTWYQLNQNNYDFIKHVMKRAYIHDDALFFYANHKGEFVYTSLNTEVNKKDGKIAKFSIENFENWNPEEKDKTIWYNSYEIINLQGIFNKESNYGGVIEYYDLIDKKEASYSNFNKMTELSFIDKDYYNKPVFGIYGGIYNSTTMYGEKYFESYVRNYFLRNNLLGFSLELNINSVIDVNLFDKVKLEMNSQITKSFDRIYSGEYLITGIAYFISMNGIFQKRIYLSRNGFNKPDQQTFIARNY